MVFEGENGVFGSQKGWILRQKCASLVKKVRIIWNFLEKFGKSGVKMCVNLEKFGIIWKNFDTDLHR